MKLKRLIFSPAGLTFAVCLAFLGIVLAHANWNPLDLVQIGTRFSQLDSTGNEGYDGQFIYYIANDPNPHSVSAHLDVPAYRYQRILLPMLARALSLGNAVAIAWTLPAIGLFANTLAVHLLSQIFQRWSINRWYALTYGLLVGNLLGLRLDLPEPLAFCLVLIAIRLQLQGRPAWAAVFYSLAIFAKETTIFFVVAQACVYIVGKRWRDLLHLALIVGLPFAIFRFWLLTTFGSLGFGLGGAGASGLELLPFNGLFRVNEYSAIYLVAIAVVYIPMILLPAVWGLVSAVARWSRGEREFSGAALIFNSTIYPFLPMSLYIEPLGTFRLAIGVQLAILLYAARFKLRRVLNYTPLWIFMDALIISQLLG